MKMASCVIMLSNIQICKPLHLIDHSAWLFVPVKIAFRRISGLTRDINCHSKEEIIHGSSQPSVFT
jgi:hypothetical protein